jgi:hypothetical protein
MENRLGEFLFSLRLRYQLRDETATLSGCWIIGAEIEEVGKICFRCEFRFAWVDFFLASRKRQGFPCGVSRH